ncbi:hypothetical protein LXL04_008289 [Taraxacum kok-saghyz]
MLVMTYPYLITDGFGEKGKQEIGVLTSVTSEFLSWRIVSNITSDKKVVKKFLASVVDGLGRAMATMKKGEVAVLTIAPEYAFGSSKSNQELAVKLAPKEVGVFLGCLEVFFDL